MFSPLRSEPLPLCFRYIMNGSTFSESQALQPRAVAIRRAATSGVVIMKKPILFLLLALGAGLSLATAAPDAPGPDFAARASSRDGGGAQEDPASSPQALCRQVEVQLDEGYGVSRRETRVVCDDNP